MKKIIGLGIVVVLGVLGYIFGVPMYKLHFSTLDLEKDKVIFYIPTGSSVTDVASILASNNIIEKESFTEFAEKLEYDDSKVEPGKYEATDGMKIKNLIYGLKNGNQEINNITITFNQCRFLEDVAGAVSKYIEADSTEIINYISASEIMEKYGFDEATMPSMFLPDTYEVGEWDMSAEEFTQFMADRYKEFWTEERKNKAEA